MYVKQDGRLHSAWWTVIFLVVLSLLLATALASFNRTFTSEVPVTVVSDRSGLVMETGAKVKLRGVQVGRVSSVEIRNDSARLDLEILADQAKLIPANVAAEIRATTVFGAKYVDLIYPDDPSSRGLRPGQQIRSRNVATEVNTVFQNLVDILEQVEPEKLNSVLSALSEGLRGKGKALGDAITDANSALLELNPRSETIRADWRSLKRFSDTYASAAPNILAVLDAAAITSTTVKANASNLDALLAGVVGFSQSGIDVLGPSKDNLVRSINQLAPTTELLLKYHPELTCTIVGGNKTITDYGWADVLSGNGYAGVLDGAFSAGDDPYRYPDNLPIIGAKGGPDGKPGCGSLPDVSKNWPVRQLVTNTGWGTGMDWRPNPGIGFPGWANYFPVTRAVPEPPSIRYQGGPAPGPAPDYPGGPPYGAPLYTPDGTPLYPGLPAGVSSDAPSAAAEAPAPSG